MSKVLDMNGESLIPGDWVVDGEGRFGRLIYNIRSDVYRVRFTDKSELELRKKILNPVTSITAIWSAHQNKVSYLGLDIYVPDTVKYIAIDSMDRVYGFEDKPIQTSIGWSSDMPSYYLGKMKLSGISWDKSLMEEVR